SFYRVVAVDTIAQESTAPATANAARPSGPADTTSPAAPQGITGSNTKTSVVLDWANNAEGDLAGYNVYRSTSATGTFTKVTGSPIAASPYTDSTAPQGVTSYYRVSAVDQDGNESGFATANQIRPYSYAAANIGTGHVAGSSTTVTAGDAYNVSGSGDIFGNA